MRRSKPKGAEHAESGAGEWRIGSGGSAAIPSAVPRALDSSLGVRAGRPHDSRRDSGATVNSQHFYAFHVDGIAFDVAGDGYVMAFVSLEGVGLSTVRTLLSPSVTTTAEAPPSMHFLVQAARAGVGALGSALGIADPAVNGLGLAHVVGREYGHRQEQDREGDNR